MCCGGKCLFFINLRTGTLIFGYISAVISAAGSIACTISAMIYLICLMFPYSTSSSYAWDQMTETLIRNASTVIIITAYFIEFLSGFICSVLLLAGITQNIPSLVKTYIIYGMIQVVVLLVFFIILHITTIFFYAGFLILAVAILGIYTMCLYMTFLTYQPMIRENAFVNPQDVVHVNLT